MISKNFRFYVLLLLVVSATMGFSSASSFAFSKYKYFLSRTVPTLYVHLPYLIGDEPIKKGKEKDSKENTNRLLAIYDLANAFISTTDEPSNKERADKKQIESYLKTLSTRLIKVAATQPTEADRALAQSTANALKANDKDYKTVDEVLYVDNKIATRYEAERYLDAHPAVVLNLNLHPNIPFEEVVEQILYVNGEIASRQQAKAYLVKHSEIVLALDLHPDSGFATGTMASVGSTKIVDEMLYVDGHLSTLAEARSHLAADPSARINLQKYLSSGEKQTSLDAVARNKYNEIDEIKVVDKVLYLNNDLATRQQAQQYIAQNPSLKGKIDLKLQPDWGEESSRLSSNETNVAITPNNALNGNGYEVLEGLLYIDGEIASRQQAKDYIKANAKYKGKINLNFQPEDGAQQASAAVTATPQNNITNEVVKTKAIKGKGFEVFDRLLYIDGEIATQQQAKDYLAQNPKLKGKLNLQMQPDWDTPTPKQAIMAMPIADANEQANATIEEADYDIIDNILYIDGDIATRAEANSYLKKNSKDRGKVKILLQPEFIDDYDPTQLIAYMPKPNLVISNPEIIDGKLFINGKVASAKEKSAFESSTGIMIKYDKMIGEYEKTLIAKNISPFDLDRDQTLAPINPNEKILLSKTYDEAIPCYAHYDGIWNNDNIFPYHYDLTKMPQQVEFLLTHGVDADFSPPAMGDITSGFGRRWGRHHNGMDIDLETGDEVRAAFEGKVRCATYSSSFGYLVVIRHYNGLETFYAHLSSLLVRPNDVVSAGTVIGLGGSTGHSTGSHLHFEVRYKGHPFNPALLIDFDTKKLRSNSFVVDRHFFSSDNPYVMDDGGGSSQHSHSTTSKAKKVGSKYYCVRKGDTLDAIADRNGSSVRKLCALNRMSSRTTLAIGRKLRIK